MNDENKIILYQDDNEITRVSVRFADEDLWLTQNQLAEIYCTTQENIGSVRKLGCKQQAYAHSFVNLKRKKGISATPLNWLLNAFTLALNDSAPALVCLFTK